MEMSLGIAAILRPVDNGVREHMGEEKPKNCTLALNILFLHFHQILKFSAMSLWGGMVWERNVTWESNRFLQNFIAVTVGGA